MYFDIGDLGVNLWIIEANNSQERFFIKLPVSHNFSLFFGAVHPAAFNRASGCTAASTGGADMTRARISVEVSNMRDISPLVESVPAQTKTRGPHLQHSGYA